MLLEMFSLCGLQYGSPLATYGYWTFNFTSFQISVAMCG